MNSLVLSVKNTIDKYNMLQFGDLVLCALSGGADSVCMTHALAALGGQLGIRLEAAHFSHGLRPDRAEEERQLCQRLCGSLGIRLHLGQGDTLAFARQKGMGTEEAARRLRYDFFAEICRAAPQKMPVATAHNLGDQAETVLMNMARGAGLAGLRGISPRGSRGDMTLLRPLIEVDRRDIEEYIARCGLEYAVDESNFSNDYARNRVRNSILPLLGQINQAAIKNIAATGFLAGQAEDYINTQAMALVRPGPAGTALDAPRLAAAHPAVAGAAVLLAVKDAGCRLGRAHIQAVVGLAGGDGSEVSLPGGRALRQGDEIIIALSNVADLAGHAAALAAELAEACLHISPGQSARWGDWQISVSHTPMPGAFCFDGGSIDFPLEIRQRRPGDRISMGKYHKTLKKLLIERKIPKYLRDIIPVLWDNNGVLCVGDIAADEGRRIKSPAPGQAVYVLVREAGSIET